MNYICIKCKATWTIGEPTDQLSGGICDRCITEYVREKQKNNGFHDCFKRAVSACSEMDCSYWEVCNRQFVACNLEDEKKRSSGE